MTDEPIEPTELIVNNDSSNNKQLTFEELPPLNTRQSLMLNYLMQGYNHTVAYQKAGYESDEHAGKAAFILINREPLKLYLEWFRNEQSRICTKEWKVSKLITIIDRSLDDYGENSPFSYNGDMALKAIAELNKMQGHYEAQNVNINIDKSIEDIRNARLEYKKDR